MIQVKNISFSYTGETLYQDATFFLPKNKKAALVGLNGAGKSTLFKLLNKEEWPDEGTIRVEGSIAMVPQEVSRDPVQDRFLTIRDYLVSAHPNKDHYLQQMLANMGLAKINLTDNPKNLSGGQKTKLALLYALFRRPDILLLDEPTNFMDDVGKKWVMHFLARYQKSLLIVSHDIDLLDQAINKVIYINRQTKKFEEYTGTYSKFKKLKAEHDENLTRCIRNQEQKIQRLEKSVERLKRSNVEKVIHQRILLERRIGKIKDTLPLLPKEVVNIKLQLPLPAHIGEIPLSVKNIYKNYGDKQVLKGLSFSIRRGERIALIGHNGAGKSTLLKTIVGSYQPDQGEVVIDERAKIGYYSQELDTLDLSASLFEIIRTNTVASEGQIRSFLAKFLFTQNRYKQTVGSLSGGEKTRISIALLVLKDFNFLILDEPTTYLDVLSQRIILEALKLYSGTMMVVSHTPDFLRELQPDKALLMPEEKLVYWDNSLLDRASEI